MVREGSPSAQGERASIVREWTYSSLIRTRAKIIRKREGAPDEKELLKRRTSLAEANLRAARMISRMSGQ